MADVAVDQQSAEEPVAEADAAEGAAAAAEPAAEAVEPTAAAEEAPEAAAQPEVAEEEPAAVAEEPTVEAEAAADAEPGMSDEAPRQEEPAGAADEVPAAVGEPADLSFGEVQLAETTSAPPTDVLTSAGPDFSEAAEVEPELEFAVPVRPAQQQQVFRAFVAEDDSGDAEKQATSFQSARPQRFDEPLAGPGTAASSQPASRSANNNVSFLTAHAARRCAAEVPHVRVNFEQN